MREMEILTISVALFAQLFAIAIIVMVAVDGWKKVVSDENSAKVAFWFSIFLVLVTGVGVLQAFQLPVLYLSWIPEWIAASLYFVASWLTTAFIVCQGTSGLYKLLKKYREYKTELEKPAVPVVVNNYTAYPNVPE